MIYILFELKEVFKKINAVKIQIDLGTCESDIFLHVDIHANILFIITIRDNLIQNLRGEAKRLKQILYM